ncbi:DASH complex subunit Dam1 [Colletotrichum karsti]|uniref:DASH complex subunit DAM1 n=1 Tax=Colletotrichum karsti TaxID=1095194 RepID=A0A9P6HT43_9PEZI|nr:DASH complex subunit Dam1 [Colletotrichum karsti]KAF9870402.1 DASH complex subunit Dam1 [Colletotrichum karsti]
MADHHEPSRQRSTSRTRMSRPTTPLRPSSRSSFRESARESIHGGEPFPLNTFEPAFAELSDAMADLEANMMHFQLMHESLARFSESFASFLYGLNMNAFCVDYPEGPIAESFRRVKEQEEPGVSSAPARVAQSVPENDGEMTFMTTDVSFVENPPASAKPTPRLKNPETKGSRVPAPSIRGASTRGTRGARRGAAESERGRPSGLARARGRGVR